MLRMLAACGEPFYYAASAWRNRGYDSSPAKCQRVGIPVISVGNITVGGTGKTPMVEWLARRALSHGLRVALVSRGYGTKQGVSNDEALELAQKLPNVPHVQNPNRVAAAEVAIREHRAECLVLDDAFQHRRIARDLDLVLLDATDPFGCGHLLPRGLLRESLRGLQRADAIVLSRANAVDATERERIWHVVDQYAPNLPRAEATHAPTMLLTGKGDSHPLSLLQGKRVAAFCGIGNPVAFKATLEASGCEVVGFRPFPDHHPFTSTTLQELNAWANELEGVDMLVCTQKDLVKLPAQESGGTSLYALAIGLEFLRGQEAIERLVDEVLLATSTENRSIVD